ncbi:MAG: hypothetical protein LBQ18_01730, partial [Campylobacteraceae bacterium]|nr:hypothetical protein [Campylobacteraceae bacterium]
MKKLLCVVSALTVMLSFVGCGGGPSIPNKPITKQFRFEGVNSFDFTQIHNPVIEYHSEDELKNMLNEKIVELLTAKRLISSDENMNILKIDTEYYRVFVGEATPLKTDSLGSPHYAYFITVVDNNNETLRSFGQKNLVFSGGFAMNLKNLAGQL